MNGITNVVIVADLHINSTVALCPPTINLDEGGTFRSSRGQRWLWNNWLSFWDEVSGLDGRKVAVVNGDLGELDIKRRSYQLVSPNKAMILKMAIQTLEPLLDAVDEVIIIRGTMAHTGKSAWLEEAVANDLTSALKHDDSGSWWQFKGAFSGVRFDISHHASMGGLPWTEKHAAMRVAEKAMWRYEIDRKRANLPHVMVRSHNHTYADSGGNYPLFAVCTPCWSLSTEYGYRTGRENDLASIGGVWFRCEHGKYEFERRLFEPAEGRPWREM